MRGGLFIPAIVLTCSCILEPTQDSGYPSEYEDSFQTDSLGEPSSCAFSSDGSFWACACEGGLILTAVSGGTSVFTTEMELYDVAFFSGTSTAAAVGSDSILIVQPGGVTSWISLESSAILVETLFPGVVVIHGDGSLTSILPDFSIDRVVTTAVTAPLSACALPGGNEIFLGDSQGISRIDTGSGSTILSVATPGAVIDLFYAGDGNLGAAIEGANELWSLDPETLSPGILFTFPAYPVVGAATPDGLFCYGGCTGDQGLVVVSSSGEQVWHSPSYGSISDIAVSPDSMRALVASQSDMSITVLGY